MGSFTVLKLIQVLKIFMSDPGVSVCCFFPKTWPADARGYITLRSQFKMRHSSIQSSQCCFNLHLNVELWCFLWHRWLLFIPSPCLPRATKLAIIFTSAIGLKQQHFKKYPFKASWSMRPHGSVVLCLLVKPSVITSNSFLLCYHSKVTALAWNQTNAALLHNNQT